MSWYVGCKLLWQLLTRCVSGSRSITTLEHSKQRSLYICTGLQVTHSCKTLYSGHGRNVLSASTRSTASTSSLGAKLS